MISKELLSVMLGIPLQNIRYNDITNLYEIFKEDLFNWSDGSYGRWSNLEVNIYELAHRCKEWALSKNYILQSSIEIDCGYCEISYIILNQVKKVLITAESEPEAIFKACEWILDKDSK